MRDIDARIARAIGWEDVRCEYGVTCGTEPQYVSIGQHYTSRVPYFSARIEDAWQLVEYLVRHGWDLSLQAWEGGAEVTWTVNDVEVCGCQFEGDHAVPRAICQSALRMLGAEVQA